MAISGLYIVKNGTPIETVKLNIRDCKDIIKDCQSDIRYANRLIKKSLTKIYQAEKKIAELKALPIVNGKVVK